MNKEMMHRFHTLSTAVVILPQNQPSSWFCMKKQAKINIKFIMILQMEAKNTHRWREYLDVLKKLKNAMKRNQEVRPMAQLLMST